MFTMFTTLVYYVRQASGDISPLNQRSEPQDGKTSEERQDF